MIITVPTLLVLIIWILISWIFNIPFFKININNNSNNNPINIVQNKPIRDVNLSPMQNVENVLSGGLSWVDYIIQTPIDQPNIVWTPTENNDVMHKYLYKKRLLFNIPAGKNWLLLVITSKPLANSRDLFLAIWGSTYWALHKDKWILTDAGNKYLFDINNLPVATFVPGISLFDNTIDWKIQLGVFAAEKDNSVKEIIMIFY